jgi:thiol-disulfide isomerase/thioredoxin
VRRWRILAKLAVLLVVLATAAPWPGAAAEAGPEEAAVGAPAPGFSLKVLNPEAAGVTWLSLQSMVGDAPEDAEARVVLVSFFASWCQPCKKELPLLVELDTRFRSLGLRVIGISIDKEEPAIAAARKLVADHRVAYPVLTDRFNLLARRYLGEQAPLPSVFLIGRDGTILAVERGYQKDASSFLRARVEAALGIKRAAAAPGAKLK